jgi:hypothetical protein
MKNHEQVMRIREDARLKELEKLIAKGKQTFVEVGLALAEIRDLRLYKREYTNFNEYCQKKWGWERRYAYNLIEGAEVVRALPESVRHGAQIDSERAARELAKVEPEDRAGVVQAIVDDGKPVTAAAIKRHLPPPPVARGDGCSATGIRPSSPPPASPADRQVSPTVPPPPASVVDGTGWPIPTHLIPLWQRADEVQEMLTTLSRVKGVLRAAQESKDKLFAEVNFSSALSQLDQAWTDIKTAKPFAVCPTCQGQLPDQCTLCRGRGLISEHRWNTCVTCEDKAFRAKAKSGSACRTGHQ